MRENIVLSLQETSEVSERRDAFIQKYTFCQLLNKHNEALSAEIREGISKRQLVLKKLVIFKLKQNLEFSLIDKKIE